MSELELACPPMPPRSTTSVFRPSEPPYTAADRPGRPGTDDHQVEPLQPQVDRRTGRNRDLRVGGVRQHRAVGEQHHRQLDAFAGGGDELPALGRVRQSRRCAGAHTPATPRGSRRHDPTTRCRRCGPCTARHGSPPPSRGACSRSSGGTSRRATPQGAPRSGRSNPARCRRRSPGRSASGPSRPTR